MQSELAAALVEDLDQLIRLHDRELDAETRAALRAVDFPYGLALLPENEAICAGCAAALADTATLDELAADYAAIYLNNSFAASPYESVWLSDDHLACAAPMFELRQCYAAAGLQVGDWRQRFDDHFVLQLQYLRNVLARAACDPSPRRSQPDAMPATPAVNPENLAIFIDEHLGYWFPDFAQRVARLAATPFYAGLVVLTDGWLRRLRSLLADLYNQPVPAREAVLQRINRKLALDKAEVAPIRFMPGAQGPSW